MNQIVQSPRNEFLAQLEEQRIDIVNALPRPEDYERFRSTLHMAVATRPELLQADRLSFWLAVRQAASDGLRPDGKDGVINIYKTKVKRRDRQTGAIVEEWIDACVWIPMILGIRKRAIELANIYIDAEPVHQNDTFKVTRGDEPKIFHEDPPLDKDRGPIVGAYAIFRKLLPSGELVILHREIMNKVQIEVVRESSKAKNGDLWTKYYGEACRKTVARRGIKYVPAVTDALMAIFQRDDALFDFSSRKPAVGGSTQTVIPPSFTAPSKPAAPAEQEAQAQPTAGVTPPRFAASAASPPPPNGASQSQPAEAGKQLSPDEVWLGKFRTAMAAITTFNDLKKLYAEKEDTIERKLSPEAREIAYAIWNEHERRLTMAA